MIKADVRSSLKQKTLDSLKSH